MKICIIGSNGHWQYALPELAKNEVLGVAPGFEGEDVSGVVDALAKNGINVQVVKSYEEFYSNADVAIVNTRFDLNAIVTAEFLKRDIFVFSEKPLATSLEQLKMLKDVQKSSKAFVCAMFGIRYEWWFKTLEGAVKNLGKIRMINAQKSYKLYTRPDFYKDIKTFGGLIPWVAIHAIDWAHALVNKDFTLVSAITDNQYNNNHGDLEMTALCQFKTDDGCVISVNADYFRPETADTHDDDRLRVVCTKGVVEYQGGKVTLIDKNGTRVLEKAPEENVFELFLRRINGEETGVSSQESFYLTELALKARDLAKAEG